MYTNWELENVCVIMFYPIIYLIFLHLPMTYTFTKLDKPHICVLLLLLYYEWNILNVSYVKVHWYGTEFRLPSRNNNHKTCCSITKCNCCKQAWRASWSLFNIKYLFIYLCKDILVIVGSWYYYTFAIYVNWIFVIGYCYVLHTWSVIKNDKYVLLVKVLL